MKRKFKHHKFRAETIEVIETANRIIEEYTRDGHTITVRQCYYQFIARDLFPDRWLVRIAGGTETKTHERNYKKLGDILTKVRYAGLVDWDAFEDRTRQIVSWRHETSPRSAIRGALEGYALDRWETQPTRVEIWVEKEALAAIFERVASRWDVSFFSCRGYHSASSAWDAHKRAEAYRRAGQQLTILHFSDHDPSGIDMSRDIEERFSVFRDGGVELRRLALNLGQVREFNPPPSPAKAGASRTPEYEEQFGTSDTWELDAMLPKDLEAIAEQEISQIVNRSAWDATEEREQEDRATLSALMENL